MATPKQRTSRARRDKKRAQKGLKLVQLVRCNNCSTGIKPHHVCPACGHYRGRQVIVGKTL
jgi:large subunit ribosomal protein L32